MTPSPRFGLGFRSQHFDALIAACEGGSSARPDWLEVLSDNLLGAGGPRRARVERLREDLPLLLHGVGLSIAGSDPLSADYLRLLRELADWCQPLWISDHLCWTSLGGHQSHDLLPPAFTRDVLDHVVERVGRVQDALGRRLALENASAYVAFRSDQCSEGEFFAELCRRSGCAMLLDVNNLYVNACNLGTDPGDVLGVIGIDDVAYMHLAGHAVLPDVRIDTHDAVVPDAVWALFEKARRRFPEAGVIVERDDNIPPLGELLAEVDRARAAVAETPSLGDTADAATSATAPIPSPSPLVVPAPRWTSLQQDFWSRIADKPLRFDHQSDEALPLLLDDTRPVRAARGMQVYSDAYTENLRRALAFNFATLAFLLRGDDFAALSSSYLRRHPPDGFDFRSLGRHLSDFLRGYAFAADYGVSGDVLAGIAAVEQARLEVADEIDETAPPLTAADLGSIAAEDWDGTRFAFAHALRIVRVGHDVAAVIEAVDQGRPPQRPSPAALAHLVRRSDEAAPASSPEQIRQARVASLVCIERISVAEADFLDDLRDNGLSFGDGCRAGCERSASPPDEFVANAARLLVRLAHWKLLSRS